MLSKFKTHEEIKKTRTFRMPITNTKKTKHFEYYIIFRAVSENVISRYDIIIFWVIKKLNLIKNIDFNEIKFWSFFCNFSSNIFKLHSWMNIQNTIK